MLYMRAAGMKATDKCTQIFPACPTVTAGERTRGLRTTRLIPDIVATDHFGTTTVFDVKVTSVASGANPSTQPLHAAKEGEKEKRRKYDTFKDNCRNAGIVDASLSNPLVPLVFENFEAAGSRPGSP